MGQPIFTQPTSEKSNNTMFYFKACPKCQGDQTLEKDAYGEYKKCLQCGTIIEVSDQEISDQEISDQKVGGEQSALPLLIDGEFQSAVAA